MKARLFFVWMITLIYSCKVNRNESDDVAATSCFYSTSLKMNYLNCNLSI